MLVGHSCPTLCDPMDCSPPGSSVHSILQARTPEWVAMPSFRGSSQARDQTHISYGFGIGSQVLYHWEALSNCWLKIYIQLESFELSFIWGKMRTAAWEAASQIALRGCSKVAVGESQYIRFWWRGSSVPWSTHFTKGFWGSDVKGFSAFLNMRRCKDWDHKICS